VLGYGAFLGEEVGIGRNRKKYLSVVWFVVYINRKRNGWMNKR